MLKDLLAIEGFDPGTVDVQFVRDFLSSWNKSIPDSSSAMDFMHRTSDIVAQLNLLYAKCERFCINAKEWVDAEYATAAIAAVGNSQSAKEKVALTDNTYLGAVDRYAMAKASLSLLKGYLEEVIRIHYVCIGILKMDSKASAAGTNFSEL